MPVNTLHCTGREEVPNVSSTKAKKPCINRLMFWEFFHIYFILMEIIQRREVGYFLTTVWMLHTYPFSPSHTHPHTFYLPAPVSLYLRLPLVTSTTTITTPRHSSPEVPVNIRQEKFISHSSGGWRSTIRVHAGLVPGEDSLPGLQTAAFSLLSHVAGRERETKFSGVFSYKGTNPLLRAPLSCLHLILIPSHLQIPPHKGLELQHMNLGSTTQPIAKPPYHIREDGVTERL